MNRRLRAFLAIMKGGLLVGLFLASAKGQDSLQPPVGLTVAANPTNINTPTFHGGLSATPSYPSSVLIYDGGVLLGSTNTFNGRLQWSFTPSSSQALSDGTHVVTAKLSDSSGRLSESSTSLVLIVDTVPPARPEFITQSGTTANRRPLIQGRGEPGATVFIYDGTVQLAAVQPDPDGKWTCSQGLVEGQHVLSLMSQDAAGNTSVGLGTITITQSTSHFDALSVRGLAGQGDKTLIVGVVMNSPNFSLLLRGLGPVLSGLVPGAIQDPRLSIYSLISDSAQWKLVSENDDWSDTAEMRQTVSAVGATPFSAGSKDAALILESFSFGNVDRVFTMHIRDAAGGSGIAMAELFDPGLPHSAGCKALSIRNQVGIGDQIMIAGFVIVGADKRVIIRGLGPALSGQVSAPLADPAIQLWRYDTGTQRWSLIGENDNWGGGAALKSAFADAYLSPLPADSKDSAMLVDLQEGVYSVHIRGAGGTSGVGMLELYEAASYPGYP